jgi:plasmid maintenance system antidote protein VapI
MAKSALKNYSVVVNKKLPALMRKKGINWAQLAEMLDVTQGAVSQAVGGNTNWHIDHVIKMTEIFGETLDWLLLDKAGSNTEAVLKKELQELRAENERLKKQLSTFTEIQELMKAQ